LFIGKIYQGPIQQFYSFSNTSTKWEDKFDLNQQNLVLSIHMMYFISDIKQSCNPEKELIEALCWKYARLGPGGKIFLVGMGAGGPVEVFQQNWFNKRNKKWGQNFFKVIESRTKLLEEKQIVSILDQKFPNTNPSIQITIQPASGFGVHRGDIATYCCSGLATPVDDNIFNLDILREAINFIRSLPIQIEQSDTPWKGRWTVPGPQLVAIITRGH